MCWLVDFWHWWTTARVASASAVVGATVAVVSGTTAVRTLRHSRLATQRTTRPMMVATLVPTGKMSAGIVVTNAGKSIARSVQVSFDPPLPIHERTSDGQRSIISFIRRRYAKPIDAWAPGHTARSEFLILVDQRDEQGRPLNIDGIPRETAIAFDYRDEDGARYRDRYSLDPTLIEGENWVKQTRKSNGKTVVRDRAPWSIS